MAELTKEKDGFDGIFFPGTVNPYAVILRVAGTGAKQEHVISSSRFLREAGFSVLCLGYQNRGLRRADASLIPLDYVRHAVEWIYEHTPSSQVNIGMTGISMGALYTLAAACYLPSLSSIALASPFDFVMEGLDSGLNPTGHSAFTWQGKELVYQPWDILRRSKRSLFFKAIRDRNYGRGRLLRYIYDHNTWSDQARLPIENIRSNVLLLASKDDDCWPADEAVLRIVKKWKETNPQREIEYVLYEKGCHNMGGDMTMHGWTGVKMRLLMKSWRTHPTECMACIEDSKQRITDFFARTLLGERTVSHSRR